MRYWVIVGSLLNLVGVGVAVFALHLDWREYGRGDLLPWMAEPFRKLRSWITPGQVRHVETHDVLGAVGAISVSIAAAGLVREQTLTLEAQLEALRRRLDHVATDLAEQNRLLGERLSVAERRVADVARDGHAAVEASREMTRGVAVGTLRLQLFGLALIGVGTVVAAVPTMFGMA